MDNADEYRGLELWGGLECTVARLGDDYRNQIAETGHDRREADLDLIAGLGIRTLRYPVLWESVAPAAPDQRDWRWHDARLGRLRTLAIAPIAGLLHHGSGPRYTSLLDPRLPQLFAQLGLEGTAGSLNAAPRVDNAPARRRTSRSSSCATPLAACSPLNARRRHSKASRASSSSLSCSGGIIAW